MPPKSYTWGRKLSLCATCRLQVYRHFLFIMVADGGKILREPLGSFEAKPSAPVGSGPLMHSCFFPCLSPFDRQHSTRLKLRWYIIQFLSSPAPPQVAERQVITLRCSSAAMFLYFEVNVCCARLSDTSSISADASSATSWVTLCHRKCTLPPHS